MSRRIYTRTYLDTRDGAFAGDMTGGRAICDDGRIRSFRPSGDGIADTFFSIPAFVYAGKRRVYGFITVDDPLPKREADVYFHAYEYRKHHALVEPLVLQPGENSAPRRQALALKVGSVVRAFHPRSMGVVWTGVVEGWRDPDPDYLHHGTIKVRFNIDGKASWLVARDIVAVNE